MASSNSCTFSASADSPMPASGGFGDEGAFATARSRARASLEHALHLRGHPGTLRTASPPIPQAPHRVPTGLGMSAFPREEGLLVFVGRRLTAELREHHVHVFRPPGTRPSRGPSGSRCRRWSGPRSAETSRGDHRSERRRLAQGPTSSPSCPRRWCGGRCPPERGEALTDPDRVGIHESPRSISVLRSRSRRSLCFPIMPQVSTIRRMDDHAKTTRSSKGRSLRPFQALGEALRTHPEGS